MSPTGGAGRSGSLPDAARAGLPTATIPIVASLATHRALSGGQIREIHMPGVGRRWGQKVMARIGASGLADRAISTDPPGRLWFATEAGARAAVETGAMPRAPRLLTAREVVGPLQAHTFAVNEAGIAFLRAARERGDDFGPLAWRHEVAHPLAEGRRRRGTRAVIADAVLSYVQAGPGGKVYVEQRFLELDRATLAVDAMADELARYAALYRAAGSESEEIWRARYPQFPEVLCVLAGAPDHLLVRRRDIALALLRAEPQMTRTPEVEIKVCLLSDLLARGPFAPIFRSLRDPGKAVDWLGRRHEEDDG